MNKFSPKQKRDPIPQYGTQWVKYRKLQNIGGQIVWKYRLEI